MRFYVEKISRNSQRHKGLRIRQKIRGVRGHEVGGSLDLRLKVLGQDSYPEVYKLAYLSLIPKIPRSTGAQRCPNINKPTSTLAPTSDIALPTPRRVNQILRIAKQNLDYSDYN